MIDLTRSGRSDGILSAVGQTPLVKLPSYLDRDDVTLYAKLEAMNPGGSAKDRPALAMIREGIRTGHITAETTVVESSSGNMGVGLATVCRAYGLAFHCVVDPRAQQENVAIMRALGATVEVVERPIEGDFLAARLARVCRIVEENERAYWPNQYSNKANPASHTVGAIAEIGNVLGSAVDYVFVATSSTGTLRGCHEYLRRRIPSAVLVAVDAVGSVLFEGVPGERKIPGLGAGRMPALANEASADRVVRVSDEDCVVGCRRAARREAFLPGGSGGGVLEAVRSMEDEIGDRVAVAILHDNGTRYLNTVYDDQWVCDELGDHVLSKIHEHADVVTPDWIAG